MKVEKFNRHKSNIGYIAAKYPTILLFLLSTIILFIPYLGNFTWIISFLFLFKEKDSRFLRLNAAQNGFILLFYSIINLSLNIIGDIILSRAISSHSSTAYINALLVHANLLQVAKIIRIIILILNAINIIISYNYYFMQLPLFGNLARKLEDKTKPGPLR